MKITTVFLLLGLFLSCNSYNRNIVGKYYNVDRKKGNSILELKNDGKFIYVFERDSFCSGEIQGKYKVINQEIQFVKRLNTIKNFLIF